MIKNLGEFRIEFSTKQDGNLRYAFGEREVVDKNRELFAQRIGINFAEIYLIDPTHSCNICVAHFDGPAIETKLYKKQPVISCDLFEGYYSGCDGCLTFDSEKFIGVLTADCIPLLIWHHATKLHGIVHVGLLGLLNNIVGHLPHIYENHNIDPATVNYYLGPSITRKNYNLTNSFLWKTVKEQACKEVPEVRKYIIERDHNEYIDTQSMLIDQLLSFGSTPSSIQLYPICTADEESKYFSHYVSRHTKLPNGRFISIIGLK